MIASEVHIKHSASAAGTVNAVNKSSSTVDLTPGRYKVSLCNEAPPGSWRDR